MELKLRGRVGRGTDTEPLVIDLVDSQVVVPADVRQMSFVEVIEFLERSLVFFEQRRALVQKRLAELSDSEAHDRLALWGDLALSDQALRDIVGQAGVLILDVEEQAMRAGQPVY